MDFIPHGRHCYRFNYTLVFKERNTAYLRPDQLKSLSEFFDAAVRLKAHVKQTRGVELRVIFADCDTAWTNTHVSCGEASLRRARDPHPAIGSRCTPT